MASSKAIEVSLGALSERFGADVMQRQTVLSALNREINAFDHEPYPILTNASPTTLTPFRWGIVPPDWTKDPDSIWHLTYKAKLEYLNRRYAWKNIQRNRCIVPATAYFEYHWNDPKGKSKTKFRIESADSKIFGIAGLYATWKDGSGQELHTYAICTTTGNDVMKFVHNKDIEKDFYRMPIMLNKADERDWLDERIPATDFAFPAYKPNLRAEPCPGENGIQTTLF
ncbi:SOS response-associated peptidase [Flavobacterium selenitireducens]|uniref:SOS response-associated peptidase n=1 Tax=Flavobacterium selenitireducens TaxID=2722704 RepID=UPI00168BC1DA|nr:SOS response-associated peptidase family protein [Flavobacterium selenitireducens]MBD3582204.1 SOS response-associated peptidase [Flavobacterium selenitireducens]